MWVNKWCWCCKVAYALHTNDVFELECLRSEICDNLDCSTRDSLSIMLWGCINEFAIAKLLADYEICYNANADLLGPNPTEAEWSEAVKADFKLKFNNVWIVADAKCSYKAAKKGFDRDKNKDYNKCNWCLYPDGDNLLLHNFITGQEYILAYNYRQVKKAYYEMLLNEGRKM